MQRFVKGQVAVKPAAIMTVPVAPELKELIGQVADDRGLSMNELIAVVLARFLKRPDLAAIPRKKRGRPSRLCAAS